MGHGTTLRQGTRILQLKKAGKLLAVLSQPFRVVFMGIMESYTSSAHTCHGNPGLSDVMVLKQCHGIRHIVKLLEQLQRIGRFLGI